MNSQTLPQDDDDRPMRPALLRGWRRRCPNCGAGPLLSGYLALTVAGLTAVGRGQRWAWLGIATLAGGGLWTLLLIASGALEFAAHRHRGIPALLLCPFHGLPQHRPLLLAPGELSPHGVGIGLHCGQCCLQPSLKQHHMLPLAVVLPGLI